MTPPARVAGFAPDLMDQSKLRALGVEILRSVDELRRCDADVVLVDVARPGVLDAVGSLRGRVIGFGRHTEPALLAAAEAAGCDEVLVRSVFFKRLADIVGGV